MTTWYNEFCDAIKEIDDSIYVLNNVAANLRRVGNVFLCNKITTETYLLEDSKEKLRKIISKKIDDDYKATMQNTKTILDAVFVGMKFGKEKV